MRLGVDVVDRLAGRQGGAVTTSQLVDLGADHDWIARQVRARRWQRAHRGVLLTFSGPTPWRSRVWSALLWAGSDAVASHDTAAALHGVRKPSAGPVHLTVPQHRRIGPEPGVVVHRRSTMPPSVGRPPRTWPGDTVVDLVERAVTHDDAYGWLCDAIRAGTRREEVLDALGRRPLARRAGLLRELLADAAAGIESPLERRYHHDVGRRHGLPRATLQERQVVSGTWIRADAVYQGLGVRAELDGALAHPGGRTDDDTWRDNAVLVERQEITLRYRWRHVFIDPCRTALQVAQALRLRGWSGTPRPCSPTCPVVRRAGT